MKTATFKKRLETFTGDASLYELSEELDGYKYVVLSAAIAYSGVETYIFGADENGNVIDWMELTGSTRGVYCHTTALENAGYEEILDLNLL